LKAIQKFQRLDGVFRPGDGLGTGAPSFR
jgi:hypothetical protein